MSLTVLAPGLHSLLVDDGRPGARHLGVPVGGPADSASFQLGNWLAGNDTPAVALEISLAGPTLRAETAIGAVIVGAPFRAEIVGKRSLDPGVGFMMEQGDVLKIGGTPNGSRAYLCVPGGFEAPERLGSRSGFGPIAAEQVLYCSTSRIAAIALGLDPIERDGTILRVLPGPQHDWFMNPAELIAANYEVQAASDRMGIRLSGAMLTRRHGELTSEPVAPGAVQVTNDGRPVVLGVDGQTIGGYPKIAHVIRADLDKMGQLRAGDRVRFQFVNADEAKAAADERTRWLNEWRTRIAVRR